MTATHPFETVKIRLQLQGELQAKELAVKKYRGVLHGVSVITKNEGLRGIYRGLGCAYVYQILLNGCRLGFYEPIRRDTTKFIFKDASVQSLGVNVFAGASSGILGAMAGSPFFLIKTRLQSYSPFLPVGTQHNYKNALDGVRQIYSAEGIRGLYRGMGASMVRTGAGSSVQLPTYFFAKRRLMKHLDMKDGLPLHLLSSSASGFVVCCFMRKHTIQLIWIFNADPTRSSGYSHGTIIQPTWKPLQGHIRLLIQNDIDGRSPGGIQGLHRTPCPNITAYNPYAYVSGADEQVGPWLRRQVHPPAHSREDLEAGFRCCLSTSACIQTTICTARRFNFTVT